MKKIKGFIKRYWNRIVSVFCIIIIAAFTVFSVGSVYAADEPTSWADVGEDVIALRDSYFAYFNSLDSGSMFSIFKSAADIPISWLKFVSGVGWVISPVDDVYYWLKNGVLNGGHRSGATAGRSGLQRGLCAVCGNTYSKCTCDVFTYSGKLLDTPPEVSAKWLKEHAQDYNNRYKPMPNEDQYILSWQNSTSNKYGTDSKVFAENVPVYEYTSGTWGGKRWNEVYVLPFFYNDDDSRGYFYGVNYTHYYSSKEDDSTVMIHSDVYSFFDNSKLDTSSSSVVWDITNYPYLGFQLDGSFFALYAYKSSSGLFLGTYGTRECTRLSYFNSEMIYSLDTSSVTLSSLISYASSNFTPVTNTADDWGYIVSNKPFENMLNQTAIDFDKIPDNYVITISGDTIYNYPITNPDTGDSTNITNYVTNNYTIPEKEPSGGGDSGGSSGTVGGKIDVSGKIEIVSSSGGTGAEFDQDLSLNNYYDWMQEQSTGFTGFMKEYLSWLPEDIVIMLCAGLALVILARFLGR